MKDKENRSRKMCRIEKEEQRRIAWKKSHKEETEEHG